MSEAEKIDILVNNAGYSLVGAFEDLPIEEKNKFETNVFGITRISQAILPTMRKQYSSRIIKISASAGRFGYPFSSAYVSTIFAVEALAERMSYELEPFGIKVIILVEPGFVKTNLLPQQLCLSNYSTQILHMHHDAQDFR
jgi:short-subunit dehydrogenase